MKYKRYVTVQGDSPALIAWKEYGNELLANYITNANPDSLQSLPLPAGIELDIPVLGEEVTNPAENPPWKGGTDGATTPPDTGTPGGTAPPPAVELNWYPGFPFADGERIHFAITRTGSQAYTIESSDGTVVENSPAFTFSAGYPVISQYISVGGLYRVKVGSLVSSYFPILGTSTPLQFYRIPTNASVGTQRKIVFAPKFAGSYPVKVTRVDSGVVVYNQQMDLAYGIDITIPVAVDDTYEVAIGPLKGVVGVFLDVDMQINRLSITNSYTGHETTIYVNANVMLDLKMEATDGTPYTVLTEPNQTVKNGDWLQGATQWAGVNYTQYFRFNPIVSGVDGIIPGKQYKLTFREKGTTSPVKEYLIFIPVTDNIIEPLDIDISGGTPGGDPGDPGTGNNAGTGVACTRGPSVNSLVSWSKEMVSWNMDGEGIYRLILYVQDTSDDSIIETAIVTFASDAGVPVFHPSYRGIYYFENELAPGTYRIGTEGKNCDSLISWSAPFEITDDTPTDPGPDPGEQTGDYIVREPTIPFPGDMKIQLTDRTNGKYVTDLVTSTIPQGSRCWYIINGKGYITPRLVNFEWDFPGPISIRKIILENWITDPVQTGGSVAGEPVRGITSFTGNGSYAQYDAIPVKQNV